MALDAGNVEAKFTADTKGVTSAFDTIENKASSTSSEIKKVVGAAAGAAIVKLGADAVKAGVEYNNTMEQYNTAFSTLLGSSSKASAFTKNLQTMAAKTPFQMTDLAKASQTLMGYGLNAKDTAKYLSVLGNISQGDATKFQSLTLAFAQMSSTGTLKGQDLLQMINAGFNPLTRLSKMTGESMAQLKDDMAAGKISSEMVQQAFVAEQEEGGRFYGALEKQSKTFNGQVSNLKDNVNILGATLTSSLTNKLKTEALPALNELTVGLSSAFQTGGIEKFANVLGVGLTKMVSGIANELPTIINGVLALVDGIVDGVVKYGPNIAAKLAVSVVSLVGGLITILPQLLNGALALVIGIVTGLAQAIPTLLPQIVNAILQIIPILLQNLPLLVHAGAQLIGGIITGLLNSIPMILNNMPLIIRALMKDIEQLPAMYMDIGEQMIRGMWNGIKNMWSWLVDNFVQLNKTMLAIIKKVLGIHSPSKEYEFVGKMTGMGEVVGLEKVKGKVQAAMNSMFDVSPSLYGQMNSQSSNRVIVYNNIESSFDPLGQVVNKIKTFSGGAKNDFNYGAAT